MIDGRFDQHFMEIFAGRDGSPPEGSAAGPVLLAAVLIGLALLACLPQLP